eukprot:195653-Rhodomonas_salina.1
MGSYSFPSRITFVASPMSGSRFTHVEARDAMRVTSKAGISLTTAGNSASASDCSGWLARPLVLKPFRVVHTHHLLAAHVHQHWLCPFPVRQLIHSAQAASERLIIEPLAVLRRPARQGPSESTMKPDR